MQLYKITTPIIVTEFVSAKSPLQAKRHAAEEIERLVKSLREDEEEWCVAAGEPVGCEVVMEDFDD